MKIRKKDPRTYADRREYMIQAVAKHRRKIKTMAIDYKGGKCQFCGYSKYHGALELHHVNPTLKELDKCMLVCANCHREVAAGIIAL